MPSVRTFAPQLPQNAFAIGNDTYSKQNTTKQRAAMETCKVRTPMQDGGIDVRCEHQCKQQWTEIATDEYIQIMCCVFFLLCCFCSEECCFCFFLFTVLFSPQVKSCFTHFCQILFHTLLTCMHQSYSSRSTISIHYISICIHIFDKISGIIRHALL